MSMRPKVAVTTTKPSKLAPAPAASAKVLKPTIKHVSPKPKKPAKENPSKIPPGVPPTKLTSVPRKLERAPLFPPPVDPRKSASTSTTTATLRKFAAKVVAETSAKIKPKPAVSSQSWRRWPAPKNSTEVLLKRSKSCDSSDSSDLSFDSSTSESGSNTSEGSNERFGQWLQHRQLTVMMDPKICNRTWKLTKLNLRKIDALKCTVRDVRFGLEYVTGIPMDATYIRFQDEEMQDWDNLEHAALNEGIVTLCAYSYWSEFVRILLSGDVANIRNAVQLNDENTAPIHNEYIVNLVPHIVGDYDRENRDNLLDAVKHIPPDLAAGNAAHIERILKSDLKLPKMPAFAAVKSKNLITDEMKSKMASDRLHAALLFAFVNKHKSLWDALLPFQPSFDYRFASGRNLAFFAIAQKNVARLEELHEAGVDLKTADQMGVEPAALANLAGDADIIAIFDDIAEEEEARKKGRLAAYRARKARSKSAKVGKSCENRDHCAYDT